MTKKLAKCDTCDYTGKLGMWKGHYGIRGKIFSFDGLVEYDQDNDEHWDLDPILPKEADDFDGMCHCPECDSINFD